MKKITFSLSAFLLILFCSCTSEFGNDCDQGSETKEKRSVELEPFTKIDLGVPGHLYIREGTQSVEIEAPSDIIDKLINESSIIDGRWRIELDNCYNGPDIDVWVSLPQFEAIRLSGSGNVTTVDTLINVSNLVLGINGSGDMEIQIEDAVNMVAEIQGSGDMNITSRNVDVQSFEIQGSGDITSHFIESQTMRMQIEGSGDLELTGKVIDNFIDIEGQGDIKAYGMCSENCTIATKGSGDCEIKVSNSLDVRIEGSGDICYKGQPAVSTDIDGSGTVKDCN